MGAGDDGLETDLSRDGNDDGWLRPSLMLDQANGGQRVLLDDLLDLLVEPLSSLDSIFRVEIAVVERRELLQLPLNLLEVHILDDLLNVGLVLDLARVGSSS